MGFGCLRLSDVLLGATGAGKDRQGEGFRPNWIARPLLHLGHLKGFGVSRLGIRGQGAGLRARTHGAGELISSESRIMLPVDVTV